MQLRNAQDVKSYIKVAYCRDANLQKQPLEVLLDKIHRKTHVLESLF